MTLDDLPIDDYRNRKSRFIPQHRVDQCLPSVILNTIKDIFARRGESMHLSLSEVGRMCSYEDGMGCPGELDLQAIFKEKLEPNNLIFRQNEGRHSTLERLREITLDDASSLPIIAVHPDYFQEVGIDSRGINEDYRLVHCIMIFGIDSTLVFTYDPYEGFLRSRHGFDEIGETINIPKFLTLWRRARTSNWMAWIEPIHRRPIDTSWEK